MVKNPPASAGEARDMSLIPGSERSPGAGIGNPLQFFSPGKFHGQRRLGGLQSMGSQEVGHS